MDYNADALSMPLTPTQKTRFRRTLYAFFKKHGRVLPWRSDPTPYHVLISEVMLQQTQVPRVSIKFAEFIQAFPDFGSLAKAPLNKVLKVWQGMGYNRRAIYLQKAAQAVVERHGGVMPSTIDGLVALPGIGPATAAAIATYAFNQPHVFIETNVRAVFIHEFFGDRNGISDAQLIPLIEQTLDTRNPRQWYSALMDYGTYLKKLHGNPARRSRHHVKQSKFEGSNRQIRGLIVKELVQNKNVSAATLAKKLGKPKEKVAANLESMSREGFVVWEKGKYRVA